MERMTGLDAGFLYMETPTLHMHTLKIAVVDPAHVPGGYRFELLKEVLGARLQHLPPFRRRVVEVPFGLHHPVWIEDPDFDLDYHVRRVAVPAPGGPLEFGELISDIASHQLDRRRPLWELWVVEGLEHGHIGVVAKIHHAAADGVAAAAMLANVLGIGAEDEVDTWKPDEVPSDWELLAGALKSLAIALGHLPQLLWRTFQGVSRLVRRRRAGGDELPPPPFSAPAVSFNRALTPHRRFVFCSLSLDDVKEVKNALDATVNDIVLALSAAALRRYLTDRGELPQRPLMAGVPVSVGEMGRSSGNRVSNLFTSIPTDIADPVERVRTVHQMMKGAKEVHNALGAEMLSDWTELTPPRPFAAFMRFYSRRGLASRHRPPINLVISNVPGPKVPLDVAGARLVSIYSMGPILEGIGLNITVWSYCGALNFGIVACRELAPDLWSLTDHLQDALEELKKAVASKRDDGGNN
jgi:diacylglycerol O-acyltransferase